MEVSSELHAQAALFSAKEPRYPFNRWLGGSQNRSGRCGKEKIPTFAENRTHVVQLVATPMLYSDGLRDR
jgi:hypothetical protein